MRLTILGSGSPEAYARRASSGYLLEVGGDKVLFDIGGGVVSNLLQAGFVPGDITHLYLSHLHSDHMMDYARLIHAAWDEGAPPLKVYGPAPVKAIHDKLFGHDGALATDLIARTELPQSREVWVARGGALPRPWPAPQITEITPDHICDHGGWQIRAAQAHHAEPLLTCMAFSLEAEGRKFVYSGDTGITGPIRALVKDADLLLHWCYRLDGEEVSAQMAATAPTPTEIARMAVEEGVGKLLLTHFRKHMDTRFDPDVLTQGDLARVGTELAEDLAQYSI